MNESHTIANAAAGTVHHVEFHVVCDRRLPNGGHLIGALLEGPFQCETAARKAMESVQLPADAMSPLQIGEYTFFN